MKVRTVIVTCLLAGTATMLSAGASDAAPKLIKYKNCATLNKAYLHGVGKPGARDNVTSGKRPVTNFGVNLKLYTLNKGLDRDKDGIACEKH